MGNGGKWRWNYPGVEAFRESKQKEQRLVPDESLGLFFFLSGS